MISSIILLLLLSIFILIKYYKNNKVNNDKNNFSYQKLLNKIESKIEDNEKLQSISFNKNTLKYDVKVSYNLDSLLMGYVNCALNADVFLLTIKDEDIGNFYHECKNKNDKVYLNVEIDNSCKNKNNFTNCTRYYDINHTLLDLNYYDLIQKNEKMINYYKSNCYYYNYSDVMNNIDYYTGESVYWTGKVTQNLESFGLYYCFININYDYSVFSMPQIIVIISSDFIIPEISSIKVGDLVDVYG